MLHQFTFKNFKSFKEETTLDLLAASIKEHETDVVTDIMSERVLKIAAIYGANASGKSNVIEAFQCMRYLVLNSFNGTHWTRCYLSLIGLKMKGYLLNLMCCFQQTKESINMAFLYLKDVW